MKTINIPWLLNLLFILFAFTLSGCDLVGDVLEFGFWTAIIIIAVIVLIVYFIARLFKK
ncbi:hypothetical protein ACFSRY_18945 [Pontibacter locisalis]|uniref:Phosphatidate cytidylyltransferase n=1 Tax=Pontibacter locisalis TaxID=1719035 RepID=A0ABW5ISE4_9BACT